MSIKSEYAKASIILMEEINSGRLSPVVIEAIETMMTACEDCIDAVLTLCDDVKSHQGHITDAVIKAKESLES